MDGSEENSGMAQWKILALATVTSNIAPRWFLLHNIIM